MMLLSLSAEDALASIGDWTDPNPTPVVECHAGVHVVRDDLLPAGAKSRFLDVLLQNSEVDEWVYGSSPRVGYGQISLAYVASRHHKRSTVFVAKAKSLHPNSLRAQEYGARIVEVPTGFLTVCGARAREYVNAHPRTRLVPFGLADDTVYGCIIRVARSLPLDPDEVWTVAGSGTLNRGLQLAFPRAKCVMVSVGHVLSGEEIGRACVYRTPLKFSQSAKVLPPFPSVPQYDAKAWEYILKFADTSKTVLFWNVGA